MLAHFARGLRNQYSARIVVWLTPLGGIYRSDFLESTGDASLDGAIEKVVRGVVIGQSPPSGLPQPVYVRQDSNN